MLVYCNYVLTFAYSFTRMEFEGSIPSLETMAITPVNKEKCMAEKAFTWRLEESLVQIIKELADEDRRSLPKYIEVIFDTHIRKMKKDKPLKTKQ